MIRGGGYETGWGVMMEVSRRLLKYNDYQSSSSERMDISVIVPSQDNHSRLKSICKYLGTFLKKSKYCPALNLIELIW